MTDWQVLFYPLSFAHFLSLEIPAIYRSRGIPEHPVPSHPESGPSAETAVSVVRGAWLPHAITTYPPRLWLFLWPHHLFWPLSSRVVNSPQ